MVGNDARCSDPGFAIGEWSLPEGGERMIYRQQRLLPLLAMVVLLATVSSVRALGRQRHLNEFGQQTWKSDSGLPQNTVHAVLQTRDGFLWIGTEGGLVRFDGVSFRTYSTETTPQLRSEIINDLKEDSSGALWICTTAGLVRERGGVFTRFATGQGLPSDSVSAVFLPRKGGVLAFTGGGVAVLHGERFDLIPGTEDVEAIDGSFAVVEDDSGWLRMPAGRRILSMRPDGSGLETAMIADGTIGEIRALAVLGTGEVWIGRRGGVEVLKDGGRANVASRDGPLSKEITALLADGVGGMWIGTSRGLERWTGGVVSQVGVAEGLVDAVVQRLFQDREGTLWVLTNRGVARVVNEHVDVMQSRSRLTGVLAIFEDREGSIWFGTDHSGLTVMREQAFATISEQDGLTASVVRAIYQDRSGTVWVGTNGGGLDRVDGGRVSALTRGAALSSDVVLSIAETGEGLWVGTPNGLDLIRNGVVKVLTTENGLADDFVRSLYADRDGSLWIGTRNGLSHYQNGGLRSYSRLDGLGSDLIGAILRGRNGDLWIGTLGGLSRLRGDEIVNYTTKDGLGSNAVTALLEDEDGTVWVGTQDAGLSRVRDGVIRALSPAKTGLPETVFGMLADMQGGVWLSSRKGIYRAGLARLNAAADGGSGFVAPTIYGVADGMRLSEGSSGGHPAAWRMRDGSLWFATLDGAATVTPESMAKNDLPPRTAIERVLVNDQPIDSVMGSPSKLLTLPPGGARIEVQYAGLSFVAPQKVRYRYRLAGFDKDWVEAGARREAFYTNVPPGHFRFLVVSSNNDGVWSTEPASFEMRVKPTLLQTWWFYALLVVAASGLVFAVYRWRVLTVKAQYQAVLQERGRIAREIHDTLAQGYVAISVQLEVAARLLESSKDAALKQLEETKALVRTSLADARSSIWNLRTQKDAEMLPSLLAAMTESRASEGGAALKLEVNGMYRPVSAAVEREILRVAQEAVANAVRHAEAKQIRVVLRYDASTLQLQVIDDGKGFTGASEDRSGNGHFGVQGMRERAERIGAKFAVRSRPGEGTLVDLQIDSRKAEREERL